MYGSLTFGDLAHEGCVGEFEIEHGIQGAIHIKYIVDGMGANIFFQITTTLYIIYLV